MLTHARGWLPPPDGYHQGARTGAVVGAAALPPAVLLDACTPPVLDQGQVGSCTGHAVACALAMRLRWQGVGAWVPSPLDLYLGARVLEGTADHDAGAMLADVLVHAERVGVAPVDVWGANDFRGPPAPSFEELRPHTRLIDWAPLDWHLDTLRWELACGVPVVLGLRAYASLDHVGADGVIPMPDGAQVGGHAVCAIGYSDSRGALLIQNSWGPGWGAKGRAWLPYSYALNPFWCGELHAVRVVRRAEEIDP